MTEREIRIYDAVVDLGIATPDEINLVRCVKDGTWEQILNSIIYARTFYRDIDQYIECELEEDVCYDI